MLVLLRTQNPSRSKISALTALLILPALPVDEPHKARYLPHRQKPDNEHEYPIYEPGYDDVRTAHRFTKRNPRRFRRRHAGVRPFLTDSGSSPELRLRYARTEDSDRHARSFQFVLERARERKQKSLAGGINRLKGNGRERVYGSDVEDPSVFSFDHSG